MSYITKVNVNETEYDIRDEFAVRDVVNSSGLSLVSEGIATIPDGLKIQIVQQLPSENIDEKTLYVLQIPISAVGSAQVGTAQVSGTVELNNAYEEWLYINNTWEKVGPVKQDLSGYVPTSRTINNKALTSDITLDGNDIGVSVSQYGYNATLNEFAHAAIQQMESIRSDIPQNTSDLTNDSGFITSSDIPKKIWYGICTDEANVLVKRVSCSGFTFTSGSIVYVKFNKGFSYTSGPYDLALNVNNTGTKNISNPSIDLNCTSNSILAFYCYGDGYTYVGKSHYEIPDSTSDLTNDSDFQTSTQVNTLIGTAIGNINQFNVAIVSTLPTTDIDNHTIYFKSNGESGSNVYEEWMYINNQWEMIGTTSIDLSGYVQTSRTINNKALSSDITLTASDVGAVAQSDLANVAFSGSYNDLIDTLPIARSEGENSLVENDVGDPWYSAKYTIYITGSGENLTYTTEDTIPVYSTGDLSKLVLVDGPSYRQITSLDTTNNTISINFPYSAQTNREVFIYELQHNVATSDYSHAEGYLTIAEKYAHAEGHRTKATGTGSHAEGRNNLARGLYSHVEGYGTETIGNYGHAEGQSTKATGTGSHAEGRNTTAVGNFAHAQGQYTTAQGRSQTVFGEYNIIDTTSTGINNKGKYIEIAGNGTSTTPSNARTLDWSGNETLAGKLTVGTPGVNSLDVATVGQLPTKTSDLTNDSNFITLSDVPAAPVTSVNGQTGAVVLSIPDAQVQSDWNETSTTSKAFILNKPTIPVVPTNVSSFTNDAGYLTLADLPIYDGTVI